MFMQLKRRRNIGGGVIFLIITNHSGMSQLISENEILIVVVFKIRIK